MAGNIIRLHFGGDTTDLDKAADKAGSSLDGLVGKVSAKGAAMGLAGAGLGLALGSAFTASLDVQDANVKLQAQMGPGSAIAGQAGEVAGKLYGQAYGENLGEVGDAVKTVMQSGALAVGATSDEIQNLTGQAMSMSQAFDQDVTGSINAAAQMVKTGLAPNAQSAMDILTVGFQQGNDKAGDLLDTFNEYGTQFRKLGIDGATAMGLISQGLQGGARDADLVADSIKEFSIRAIDGSTTTIDGFTRLGLSAQGMSAKIAAGGPAAKAGLGEVLDKLRAVKDPADQAAIATELFGTQAEDLGKALFTLDPSSATAKLGDFAGAAGKVDQTLGSTVHAKLEASKRDFEQLTQSIVGINGPIGTVAAGVMNFGGDALTMAGSLGMAAMALKDMGIASKLAAAGQWLLNLAMDANPIGIVVIAIAALVGGLIWAYNNIGWFKDGVDAAFSFIGPFIGGVVDFIVGAWNGAVSFFSGLPATIGGFIDGIGAWFGSLPGMAGDALGAVGNWFASLPGMIGDGLATGGSAVLDFLGQLPGWFATGLGYAAGTVWVFFTETLPTAIGEGLALLGTVISTGATAAWDFLWNVMPGVLANVIIWLQSLPSMALDALTSFGTWLGEVSTLAWQMFLDSATTKGAEFLGWLATVPGTVGSFLASLPGIIGNAAVAAWQWFLNATTTGAQNALNWISGIPGKVGGFFANAGSWLFEAGKNILQGLWNGLKSIAQGVLDWITGIGKSIAAGFNAAVGNHSPSKIFFESATNIGLGFIGGVEAIAPDMVSSVADTADPMIDMYAGLTLPLPDAGGDDGSGQGGGGWGAQGGGQGGGGAVVSFTGNTSDALATVIMELIRTDKIQIKAA